ncbi:MAG: VOC family protein [Flavobacteriales bacterium]|nr:VOC family protein [Flavobacteriales bacterium]
MKTSPMHGLRTVINIVPDLDKAKAWYAKAFGTEPYFDEPFYVGFNIGGYELGLIPEEGEPKPRGENVMTYWGVDDVQQAFDRLISLGASSHEEPHNVGGELVVGAVKDPWGNVLGLIHNPDFKLPDRDIDAIH